MKTSTRYSTIFSIMLMLLLSVGLRAQVTADFTITYPATCSLPARVTFTDISTTVNGTITNRYWSFSNGTTVNTGVSTGVTFTQPAIFDAQLIVVNSLGERDTMIKLGAIDLTGYLSVSATITNTSCSNCTDGSIAISTIGGAQPYNYLWSDGSTQATLVNTLPGNYSVTISDAGSCSLVKNYVLDSLCYQNFGAAIYPVGCSYPNPEGKIDINPLGNSGWTYQWSNGETTQDIIVPVAGTYNLTITDNTGCFERYSFDVDSLSLLTLYANVTPLQGNCSFLCVGAIGIKPTTATGPYNFDWGVFCVNGPCSFDTLPIPPGLGQVIVTDSRNCKNTSTYNITAPCSFTSTITTAPVSCVDAQDGAATVVTSGGTAPYIYTWRTYPHQTGVTSITNVQAGTYNLEVVDATGCTTYEVFTIGAVDTIMAQSVITNAACTNCTNGAIDITVTGGASPYTYVWPSGATSEDVQTLEPGSYTVTITDANSCVAYDTIVVNSICSFALSMDSINVLCFGTNSGKAWATASVGTGPYTYLWSNGQNTDTAFNLIAGIYYVTVTDGGGCSVVDSVTIAEPTELLSVMDANNITCAGGTDGKVWVTALGGTPFYTYSWSAGAATAGGDTVVGLVAGWYYVTVTDNFGCSVLDSIEVGAPLPIVLTTTTTDASCFGDADGRAWVTASINNPPVNYAWSAGVPSGVDDTVSNLQAGTYFVTVTNSLGCFGIDTFTIGEPTELTLTDSVTNTSCPGCNDGEIDITVAGGTPSYTYQWLGVSPNTEDQLNAPIGNYTVIVTDNNGCTITDNYNVLYNCNMAVSLGNDTALCFGINTINAAVTNATGALNYVWGDGTTADTLAVSAQGTYTLAVSDGAGCAASDTIVITDANPAAQAAGDTTICAGGSASISASGGSAYSWSPSTGLSDASIANPIATPTVSTLYTVSIDNGTCISTQTVNVDVDTDCVWPGDANNSGLADNDDVLAIGIGYGFTGPLRTNASIVWQSEGAADWANFLLSGTNYKHIDTNGDGGVNDDDTLAVAVNYGLTHLKTSDGNRSVNPNLFVDLPDTVFASQTVVAPIYLGQDTAPIQNVYGVKFSITYDNTIVDTNTVSITFNNSWLGALGTDLLGFSKDLYALGKVDVALTRTNQVSVNGGGPIGYLSFTMKDDVSGKDWLAIPMDVEILSERGIDELENDLVLTTGAKTIIVLQDTATGIAQYQRQQINVYPNPTNGLLHIATGSVVQVDKVTLINVLGQSIEPVMVSSSSKGFDLDLSLLARGVYMVNVVTSQGVVAKRILLN